jgi:hypothetical protein
MEPKPPPPGVSAELPARPLEPPLRGEGLLLRWMLFLLGAAVAGAAWLAVRSESSAAVRNVLDTILQLGFGVLLALGAYRLLVCFPFRILDLLAMVFMLAVGIKLTLEALAGAARYGLIEWGPWSGREHVGTLALACLLTSSMLLAGAALGLRYCLRLRLDRPAERVAALVYGMLGFPAALGFFAFPALIVVDFIPPRVPNEGTLLYLLLYLGACLVTARNTILLMRSMALDSEVQVK